MANRKSDGDNMLTKVARAVGSALGTMASKATNLVGSNSVHSPSKPKRKGKKAKTATGPQEKAQPRKQAKRTERKSKLYAKNCRGRERLRAG